MGEGREKKERGGRRERGRGPDPENTPVTSHLEGGEIKGEHHTKNIKLGLKMIITQ